MNSERLKKLEALLGRVQQNAQAPRTVTVVMNGSGAGAQALAQQVAPRPPDLEPESSEELLQVEVGEEILDEHLIEEVDGLELEAAEDLAEEQPPASSRRVAASMDEALAGVAQHLEKPKTIPPESGPEPVSAKEAELERSPHLPTAEQLGGTVSLEEGPGTDLELDEPLSEPASARRDEAASLEAELPRVGAYSQNLAPPADAREELERVRLGEIKAEVMTRPVISTNVVEFIQAQAQHQPESFAALVDGALSLGQD